MLEKKDLQKLNDFIELMKEYHQLLDKSKKQIASTKELSRFFELTSIIEGKIAKKPATQKEKFTHVGFMAIGFAIGLVLIKVFSFFTDF